jgi:hypothetical protein
MPRKPFTVTNAQPVYVQEAELAAVALDELDAVRP